MKKRICLIALCVLMLVALFPEKAAKADDGLSFVSVNDYLPPELINVMVSYGGVIYMPYWFYTNYGLGLYYSYFSSNGTAYLYNSKRQVFFELSSGKTYDGDDNTYAVSAILWGGTVYLPLSFVRNFFGGFTFRTIGSNEYGSIFRVTTGAEVLSDDEFFRAAAGAMQRYYQSMHTTAPATPEPVRPTPTPKPVRTGDTIRLGLDGLPTETVLDLLRRQEIEVCFFLRTEEIRDNPDLIRRIACEGHALAVCSPEGDARACAEAAALLWETARVRTIMAAMPEGAVQPENMVVFPAVRTETPPEDPEETVTSVMAKLEMRAGDQTLIFPISGENITALRMLLRDLHDLDFSVTAIRLTDGGGTPVVP